MADSTDNTRDQLVHKSFEMKDVDLSKQTHDACGCTPAEEKHKIAQGQFIKSLIYGGLDGIISTFVVICSIEGGSFNPVYALVLGFSNLVGDGISMGVGEYLSGKADMEHQQTEYQREKWEFEHNPEGEITEMIELLQDKGVSPEDTELIIRTTAKYPELFLDQMMYYELGFMPLEEDEKPIKKGRIHHVLCYLCTHSSPPTHIKRGFMTFLAFCAFGLVPMLSYVGFGYVPWNTVTALKGFNPTFAISCVATAATLLLLGAVKARFSNENKIISSLKTLATGGAACVIAWLIGYFLSKYIIDEDHDICNY